MARAVAKMELNRLVRLVVKLLAPAICAQSGNILCVAQETIYLFLVTGNSSRLFLSLSSLGYRLLLKVIQSLFHSLVLLSNHSGLALLMAFELLSLDQEVRVISSIILQCKIAESDNIRRNVVDQVAIARHD